MKYTQIPSDTFQKLQMNAGMLVRNVNLATGVVSGLLGATTGGINFTATPSYTDLGDDVDNCPKNTKELKLLDSIEVSMSGTFVSMDVNTAKDLVAAADVDESDPTHIIPRNDLESTDFKDLWWIGDYSDVNTGANAGFCAIHLRNALNTGGFQIQSTDKAKGQFAFTFTGHYSINEQDTVPYEIYIQAGSEETQPSIYLDAHSITLSEDDTYTFATAVVPSDAEITWTSGSASVATVSNGVVTAVGTGNTIITASITVSGVTYTDTCTVVVTAG